MFASVGHTGDSTAYDFNGFQMFLDTEGNVYRFGYNNYGQLGDGSTTSNYFAKNMQQVHLIMKNYLYNWYRLSA